MPVGMKHLITCRCTLPQFKRMESPPRHQFVVFSSIEDDGNMMPKFSQCNNCGVIHKVVDISKSEIMMGKEAMGSLVTIDDIKAGMNPRLAAILEGNDVDLPSWEYAQFICNHQQWGSFIVLRTDEDSGLRQGKYLRILGENMFNVESFTREEIVK